MEIAIRYNATKSNIFFNENPTGASKEIPVVTRLGCWDRFCEFFRLERYKKWCSIRVSPLSSKSSSPLLLFVKVDALAKCFSWKPSEVRTFYRNKGLEERINQTIHRIQKKTFDFSNLETQTAGLSEQQLFPLKQTALGKGAHFQGKIYFLKETFKETDREKTPSKKDRIKVKVNDGKILFLPIIPKEAGVSKKVFFDLDLTEKCLIARSEQSLINGTLKKSGVETEIDLFTRLKDSPYVVKLFNVKKKQTESETKFTCNMEYCEGGAIEQAHRGLSLKELLVVFEDGLRGLSELSKLGYCHFDVHGENLLVKEMRGKLTDFGNARLVANVMNDDYFWNEMIQNKFWTANELTFSKEMLIRLLQLKVKYEGFKDLSPKEKKEINRFLESLPAVNITEKVDVWRYGLLMAFKLYRADRKDLRRCVFRRKTPAFLHFARFFDPNIRKANYHQLMFMIKLLMKPTKAPRNKQSLEYLLWEMCHPDPNLRPTLLQAANRLKAFHGIETYSK